MKLSQRKRTSIASHISDFRDDHPAILSLIIAILTLVALYTASSQCFVREDKLVPKTMKVTSMSDSTVNFHTDDKFAIKGSYKVSNVYEDIHEDKNGRVKGYFSPDLEKCFLTKSSYADEVCAVCFVLSFILALTLWLWLFLIIFG